MDKIYEQFTYLMNNTSSDEEKLQVSQRVQYLIKNMFDNKNSGWSKSSSHKELQTKEQVETEMYKAAAMAEEAQQRNRSGYNDYHDKGGKYGDKRDGRDNRGGGRKNEGQQVYLAKQ